MAAALAVVAVAAGPAGCKKKSTAEDEAPAAGGKQQPAARPAVDRAAAARALTAAPWQGIVGGQAALLMVKTGSGGRLLGVLMHGKQQASCTLKLHEDGGVEIKTVGRPTQRGLSYMSLYGKLAPDLGSISGKLSHVVKSGFVESSSGGGEFQLEQGDDKTEIAFYSSACEGDNMMGCYHLAFAHLKGQGVAKDPEKMEALFKKACVGGLLEACNTLGLVFHLGEGVPKDLDKSVSYWGKACDDGHLKSCRDLGQALLNKDFKKAVAYQKKACDGGHAGGCNSFAWNLAGKGKRLDQALAAAQKAVKLDPRAAYIDTLAFVHFKRKEYTRAEMEALRALKLDPDVAEHKQRLEDIRAAMARGN
jgi:TPR repeat protein